MARLDERLTRELERAARAADPSGVYEHLIRRKERRRLIRRAESAGLAVLVIVGAGLGFLGLWEVFRPAERPAAGVANGRIAFTNFEVGQEGLPEGFSGWFVYAMEPDGSDITFVGPSGVDESLFPTFSPDGRRIAFAGYLEATRERALYVMDADGGSLTKVFTLDQRHQIDGLAWSPDGGRIGMLYTELVPIEPRPDAGPRHGLVSTIWTIAPDGSDLRQVTTVGREGPFSWSPDGERIAFSRHESADPGENPYRSNDLYVVSADGTRETQLTHDGVSKSPAWSPDGTLIAFQGSEPDEGYDLYVMNADGTGRRRLTSDPGNEYGAVWAPDGSLIAYAERTSDGTTSRCFVSTIRPDGSGRTRLFGTADVDGCPGQAGISWAPALEEAIETPTPPSTSVSGSPSPSPPPRTGEDVGLGLRLCDVTSVPGHFLGEGAETQTAFVGTEPAGDGCSRVEELTGVAAIDLSGDGVADVASAPFECQGLCGAYAAPDVDGDGTDELLVQNVAFSIVGLRLFDLVPGEDGPALVMAMVEPPGDAALGIEGFDGSGPPQFWIGGDAFIADALRCEPSPDGRVLVSTTAESLPHDSPDAVWQVHETVFSLDAGTLRVLEARDFEEPVGAGTPAFLSTAGCGADLRP